MKSCCCTNQCPACGLCCQVDCGHRRAAGGFTTTTISTTPVVWSKPITEEDVRRIFREELGRARDRS